MYFSLLDHSNIFNLQAAQHIFSPALFLSNVSRQFRADRFCITLRPCNDQERVVARKRADHIFPLQCVKNLACGVGHARIALYQHNMSGVIYPQHGFMKDRFKPSLRFGLKLSFRLET